MALVTHPRLENLLASLSLNLAEEAATALERVSGLAGSATAGLLALEEFLDHSHIGRLADALGLTHSGTVRLVSQLEASGLAVRRVGADRRRVEVSLTPRGRGRARAARAARDAILRDTTSGLDDDEAATLEELLTKLIQARVSARVVDRRAGRSAPWWCRTCDFTACGRPDGRCPAYATAVRNTQA
jgi:DNA-binding MarR family transcriptional regulator